MKYENIYLDPGIELRPENDDFQVITYDAEGVESVGYRSVGQFI